MFSASPLAAVPLTVLDMTSASKSVSAAGKTLDTGLEVVVPSVLGGCSVAGSDWSRTVVDRVGPAVSGRCVESAPLSEATLANGTDEANASYGRL